MLSNRLAFALLAVACVGAAAGGGYLASRQNVAPAPVSAAAVTTPAVNPAPAPVQETEATVASREIKAEAAPAEAPRPVAAAPAPSKRNEPVAKVAQTGARNAKPAS